MSSSHANRLGQRAARERVAGSVLSAIGAPPCWPWNQSECLAAAKGISGDPRGGRVAPPRALAAGTVLAVIEKSPRWPGSGDRLDLEVNIGSSRADRMCRRPSRLRARARLARYHLQ